MRGVQARHDPHPNRSRLLDSTCGKCVWSSHRIHSTLRQRMPQAEVYGGGVDCARSMCAHLPPVKVIPEMSHLGGSGSGGMLPETHWSHWLLWLVDSCAYRWQVTLVGIPPLTPQQPRCSIRLRPHVVCSQLPCLSTILCCCYIMPVVVWKSSSIGSLLDTASFLGSLHELPAVSAHE